MRLLGGVLIGLCGAAVAAYLISRDDIADDLPDWSDPTLPPQARTSSLPRATVAGDAASPRVLGDILIIEGDGFETVHPRLCSGRYRIADDRSAWGDYVHHGSDFYLR